MDKTEQDKIRQDRARKDKTRTEKEEKTEKTTNSSVKCRTNQNNFTLYETTLSITKGKNTY